MFPPSSLNSSPDCCRFVKEEPCLAPRDGRAAPLSTCLACPRFAATSDVTALKNSLHECLHAGEAREAAELNREFTRNFQAVFSMVEKLCQGDPAARITISTDHDLMRTLDGMLNRLGENIEEMVDNSHEMAIGLCEHYDTLLRIAAGDFSARASTDSPNELVAKLGELINRGTETLVGAIRKLEQTDDELKGAYRRLQDIIEFLPDATFVIDRERRVISWNRAMEEMSGVPKEEILGKSGYAYSVPFYGFPRPALIDCLDGGDDSCRDNYSFVREKGGKFFAETFVPGFRGGNGVYIWITASSLYDRDGNTVGAIESVRDITDFKRAEEEKSDLKLQLLQSQKMEAIGQLAGGIAHDFNNVLTAIIGFAHLLTLKADDPEFCQKTGEKIVLSAGQAAKLVKDLLTYSRRQLMDLRAVDLGIVVGGMEEMLQRLIGDDITLDVLPFPEALTVLADTVPLQQVLMNLATNARDAMPEGGTLTIRGERISLTEESGVGLPAGNYAVISFSDTGIGMDQATLEKIFDPFFTTKEPGKGSGLGLSIAFGIVGQHNGRIAVESTPGNGSTFRIYLPISLAPSRIPAIEKPLSNGVTPRGNGTILLAEDNTAARGVIADTLSRAGFRVITAADGAEAVEAFRLHADEVDLVILDVMMPRMNGREALREMSELRPGVRALFTSGYAPDTIRQRGKLEDEMPFVPKPISPDTLLSAVRRVLEGGGNSPS